MAAAPATPRFHPSSKRRARRKMGPRAPRRRSAAIAAASRIFVGRISHDARLLVREQGPHLAKGYREGVLLGQPFRPETHLRLRIAPTFQEDIDAKDPRDAHEGRQNGRALGERGQDLKDGHLWFVHDPRQPPGGKDALSRGATRYTRRCPTGWRFVKSKRPMPPKGRGRHTERGCHRVEEVARTWVRRGGRLTSACARG